MNKFISTILLTCIALTSNLFAQKKNSNSETESQIKSSILSGLNFRSVGPALTSGRIADLAINPNNHFEYYIAVASGGVWKTSNNGTSYHPIFDGEGSYSIACVELAPNNSNIVWVGAGENNNQRSVAYGDGVYKSEDGGKSFKNMGLKNSEHIGNIIIHPTNPNTVWVAAYGPLWSSGGERGVYKTIDGGITWKNVLSISENTGISEIAIDPQNPKTLYAAAHQRRRHVFTYIDGGPETALYKSTDGGENWNKLSNGLPSGEVGRIGIAVSPANSDYVYAIVKASNEKGGFFRSIDRGASFSKMSSYQTSGNYYQEIICDPFNKDKVFSMNTWLHHTEDGGKTFKKTGENFKHVDNHAMWIDPNNTDHWLLGCDGGIYETYNHAKDWAFKPNLPVTQFYKVAVDNNLPFYNIYGGTQDNNSMGGPSRTINSDGINNSDWYITNGGDGFESQIDPTDPNIVYAQAQYGWLVRYDKASGEKVGIQPLAKPNEKALRWNWDAPLLISPHDNKTLYFSANKVFKSTDRGNSWAVISPDLSQQIDRNKLPVMGRVWGVDAVMKNQSTTMYGNIVAFDESPVKKGLLFAGTDDGLIQVSENDGASWSKQNSFNGVPENTYVNMIIASNHNENVVYAAFNNHKNGDFKPYLLKSENKGKSWTQIQNNLPERGSIYSIAEDHINPNLLFAGTEFGVFFSINGGKEWIQLKSGLPTIAIRDIAIQKRENDLVLASFGRGFYVLDDYSSLRELTPELLKKDAHIFSNTKPALLYIEKNPIGGRGKSNQGENYFTTQNPKVGATFTYYVKDKFKTKKETRQEAEAKLLKDGKDTPYPSIKELSIEDNEEKPYLLFIIKDNKGDIIRKMTTSPKSGINRITWNFRMFTTSPIQLKTNEPGRYDSYDEGPLALSGYYTIELYKSENGVLSALAPPTPFEVKALNNQTLIDKNKEKSMAFHKNVAELRRSISGASKLLSETNNRVKYIKSAIKNYPSVPLDLMPEVKLIESEIQKINLGMYGNNSKSSREFETLPSITGRIGTIIYQTWYTTSAPTESAKNELTIVEKEFPILLNQLKEVIKRVKVLEEKLSEYNTPYTPGRDENWKIE